MIDVLIKLSCFILFSLFYIGNVSAFETSELRNKIAFLRNGDVWITDQSGREIKQITKTDGNVGKFLFSPTLRYLAYSKFIKYVDDPGIYEEGDAPKVPVYSIIIIDLKKQKIMKEIKPPISEGDNWIYMDKWLPNGKLMFYSADGFAVSWYFMYDPTTNSNEEMENTEEKSRLTGADIHREGSLMVYSYMSVLEITDLKSKKVKTLNPTKTTRNKFNPKISNGKEYIGWLEVDHEVNDKDFYALWVYNLKTGATNTLYKDYTTVGNLSWSFDDKFLCMFDDRFQQEAVIVELQNPRNIHKIEAKGPVWISNNKIAYTQGTNIYVYSLDTKKNELLIENAYEPMFLWQEPVKSISANKNL